MRRKYFGLAMAAIAALGPTQGFGGDREIAQSILERLKVSRDAGELKHFTLDMKVDDGVVLFRGKVSGDQQRDVVLAASKHLEGVVEVVDQLEIDTLATPTETASTRTAQIFRPAGMKLAAQSADPAASPSTETPIAALANLDATEVAAAAPSDDNGFDFAEALAGQGSSEAMPTAVNIPAPMADRIVESKAEAVLDELEATVQSIAEKTEQSSPTPAMIDSDTIGENEAFLAETKPASLPMPPLANFEQEVVPGVVLPATAIDQDEDTPPPPVEAVDDEQLTRLVARAIGKAQAEGHLRDFGVDVNAYDGVIELEGNVASQQQRQFIELIAQHCPGAVGVRNLIEIRTPSRKTSTGTAAQPVAHRRLAPQVMPTRQTPTLRPLPTPSQSNVSARRPMPQPTMAPSPNQFGPRGVPARQAAYGPSAMSQGQQYINGEMVVPGSIVNHGPVDYHDGGYAGPAPGAAPMMGQPVPMAPAAAVGAPRYDSPNLPNYAWPGYAAHPNYAALSYPQQYSPSAFPFIGPFYPYPQVPLGWRKVSLEWDDGWWFLDFTDR